MITKNDCYLILNDLEERGIDTTNTLKELASSRDVTLGVLKFINDNRELELSRFYEKLRKSYNQKKSKLYINIMRGFEEKDIKNILTTLNSYALQITLFYNKIEDKIKAEMFLKHARLQEIYKCLFAYTKTKDLYSCIKLLNLIKIDIKALESTYRDA